MVVHWNEVHITEHKAVVVMVLQGLLEAYVEELSSIEHGVSSLVQRQSGMRMHKTFKENTHKDQ